jgi:hypothetical protein
VSTEIKDRRLFIPSEFMGLPDLTGIMRHGNSLVKIKLPYMSAIRQAEAFIPRPGKPIERVELKPLPVKPDVPQQQSVDEKPADPNPDRKRRGEKATAGKPKIDPPNLLASEEDSALIAVGTGPKTNSTTTSDAQVDIDFD